MAKQRKTVVEDQLLDQVLKNQEASGSVDGVVLSTVTAIAEDGAPVVDVFGKSVPARSLVATGKDSIGREVALLFEGGQTSAPILMGFLNHTELEAEASQPLAVEVDGESVRVEAQKEIVLRCGKSSITLTRAGKILIRGAFLVSRSTGVNRIKGGSVQIN